MDYGNCGPDGYAVVKPTNPQYDAPKDGETPCLTSEVTASAVGRLLEGYV